mmetsp:Transcript_116090/g.328511  ORF Transcript_116090/g.328511 Transcript_116090/m.328511 type:complete len:995 (-) Transcript_116090:110-3094(-)|eukprot:CAMPEP_0117529082 /NCGR_PEP_ID=MMETSP0784-20121206/37649_1 /TAXON_ID=39447 /ORGANISM="" /LENGTH=994 /DNA_ID=CAMNT_0005325393 /DNA_START=52 /DNA_END=3036 /DNA_ORIENTATION=-
MEADAEEEDGANEVMTAPPPPLFEMKHAKMLKKQGSFMPKIAEGQATRKQLIEYLSVLKWTRACCVSLPFTILLWLVLLASVSLQAATEGIFGVRKAILNHFEILEAVSTRGVAPTEIYSESSSGGSFCNCACAVSGPAAFCHYDGAKVTELRQPLEPIALLNGTLTPAELQVLRSRGAQYSLRDMDVTPPKRSTDLQSIDDVWFWIQHGLIPEMWDEVASDTPLQLAPMLDPAGPATAEQGSATPGLLLNRNQIVGGLRMRQRRVLPETCPGDSQVSQRYSPGGCYGNKVQTDPYGPGTTSYAEGFLPNEEGDREAYDVYLDVQRPLHVATETLEWMLKAHTWLDDGSESLTLQAMMLNAEVSPSLISLLQVDIQFDRNGGFVMSMDLRSSATQPYPTIIHVLLDLVWLGLVCVILFQSLGRVFGSCFRRRDEEPCFCGAELMPGQTVCLECERKQDIGGGGCNAWNALDWGTVFLSMCIAMFWWIISTEILSIVDAIGAMPAVPPFGAPEENVRQYHSVWGAILDRVVRLMQWREVHRLSLFWYTLVLTLQFFKVFRGQPKLAQLSYVMLNAAEDMLHFIFVFLSIFLNFAFSGFMIFGLHLDEWSTPMQALNSSFRTLLGDVALTEMYEVAPVSTIMWMSMFVTVLICVAFNLLLAMVLDHYTIIKAEAGSSVGFYTQLKLAIKDSWANCKCYDVLRCLCFCFPCICKRRSSAKSPAEIIDILMDACGYSTDDRQLVRSSVLGPKLQRRGMDRLMFTGQSLDGRRANELGGPDMIEAGADGDYVDDLQEKATAHSLREADPEDMKANQLRELVAKAEAGMLQMHDRLEQSQLNLKGSTDGMVRQLQLVEQLVHLALKEIALIADSAGVPDRFEIPRGMPMAKATEHMGSSEAGQAQLRQKSMILAVQQSAVGKKATRYLGAPSENAVAIHPKARSEQQKRREIKMATSKAMDEHIALARPPDLKARSAEQPVRLVDRWHSAMRTAGYSGTV